MGAVLFIGALTGFLGFGLCGLVAVATLEQHGLADWKTALVWGLLSICFLAIAALSTSYAEKIGLRQQPARHARCCECRGCDCGPDKESNKEKDNGETEDQR